MYLLVLLGVLISLILVDSYLTLKMFSKRGWRVEGNPILRDLLRDNIWKFLMFKVADTFLLSAVIYAIYTRNEMFATSILGVCIFMYAYIDYKNFKARAALR